MNIGTDLELLKRRVALIEGNLSGVRERIETLEKLIRAEEPSRKTTVDCGAWEPPATEVPVVRPDENMKRPAPPSPVFDRHDEPVAVWFPVDVPAPRAALTKDEVNAPSPTFHPEWKDWLQRLQLWPPAGDGEGNAEVRLGAWWATRLGTLLAVIGVVFFGVYVSINTLPWVKFSELVAISSVVAGVGLRLERRLPRFGAVVFAGGLALLYFCAFAGYALPAVRVMTSPVAAAGWQLAAVLLLTGAAVWRRSPTVATMAIVFGYATALFSRAGGLHEFALYTAALLGAVSVVFHRRLRWEAPSVVAMPGTYAVYAFVLQGNWLRGGEPAQGWAWLFLGTVTALFFCRDWRGRKVTSAEVSMGERWFQGMNSSLAVLLGVVTALTLYRGSLAGFYFGAALALGAMAFVRHRRIEGDVIAAVLMAKCTGALTLGVIETVGGRTTAVALLVQAWVMLFAARRLGSRVLAAGTMIVALVATGFFFRDAMIPVPAVSLAAAGAVGFVAGLALLATEIARRLMNSASPEERHTVEGAGAITAAAGAVLAVLHWQPQGWSPALWVGVSVIFGVAAVLRKSWGPAAAGAAVLATAHGQLWLMALDVSDGGSLRTNAWCVLVPTAVLGWFLGRTTAGANRRVAQAGTACWAAVVVGGVLVGFHGTQPTAVFGVVTGAALLLAGLTPWLKTRHMPWLATLASGLAAILWLHAGAPNWPAQGLAAVVAGLWLLPLGLRVSPSHHAAQQTEPWAKGQVMLQVALATLMTLRAVPVYFSGSAEILALAAIAMAAFGFARRPGLRPALEASWVFWVAAGAASISGESSGLDRLMLVGAAALAWVPAVVMARGAAETQGCWWRRCMQGVQVTLATLFTCRIAVDGFRETARVAVLVAAVLMVVAIFRWGRVAAARRGALGLSLVATWLAAALVRRGQAEGLGAGLALVGLVATLLAALPLVLAGGPEPLDRKAVAILRWLLGTVSLSLVFYGAAAQRGVLGPYASIGWGGGAIAVFMAGLFLRVRPYRLLGLAGMALCVLRVFMVDLHSPLHRIGAFVVLGLVLLWVGFSYHRFRHLIVEEAAEDKIL